MRQLFQSRKHSDFAIAVGGQTFDVHRCVLAQRWPYFKGILLKNHPRFAIHETEMPSSTFEKMLEFFYTFAVPKDIHYRDSGWILSLSEFYGLTDLEHCSALLNHCDRGINKKVSKKNLEHTIRVAVELNDNELERKFVDAFNDFNITDGLQFVTDILKKKQRLQDRTNEIENEIRDQGKQIKRLKKLAGGK